MENTCVPIGGAYQRTYVTCSFFHGLPKEDSDLPQTALAFCGMQICSHLHVAEQSAPRRREKIQQHFYSSQRHRCYVCPGVTMPPDGETRATASSSH